MENFEGNYSRRTKIKLPLEIQAQRLMIGGSPNRGESLSRTRFDTENVGLNSPILRYLCGGGSRSPISPGNLAPRGSRSPLLSVENLINRSPPPSAYRTPVKAVDGEEVLVMDGLPFQKRSRFSGSESSGSSGKSLFKADIFQSSENSGDSRQSPKVQLYRTKEDQRATCLTIKKITESQVNDNSKYDIPGLFNLSPDSLFLPQTLSPTFSELGATPARTSSPAEPRTPVRSASPTETMPSTFHGGNYCARPPREFTFFPTPPLPSSSENSPSTILDILASFTSPNKPTSPDEMAPPEPQKPFLMDTSKTGEETRLEFEKNFPMLSASLKNKTARTSAPTPEITPATTSAITLAPTPAITSASTLAITSAPTSEITPAPTPPITSSPTLAINSALTPATQTTAMIAPQAPPERWSPQDDGIIMEGKDDEYIDSILASGFPTCARRFSAFCPDP